MIETKYSEKDYFENALATKRSKNIVFTKCEEQIFKIIFFTVFSANYIKNAFTTKPKNAKIKSTWRQYESKRSNPIWNKRIK